MRILLAIHEELNPDSGAAGSTYRLGEEYIKFGHEVTFFSFNNLPKWMPLALKDLFFPEFLAVYLAKNSITETFDVIDASTGDAWFWSKFFRSNSRPILVTRSHYLEHLGHRQALEANQLGVLALSWRYSLYRGSINLWEVASSLRSSDLIFMLNNEEKHFSVQELGITADKIHLVSNGIPNLFLGLAYSPLPIVSTTPLSIAIVGSYILRKGIQYSVPALNRILQRYPFIRVTFLGTLFPENDVKNDFDIIVHNRIHVIQHYEHEHLPSLLHNHQISILASTYEAFGKALIETMACGLAPIATATAGPLKILTDGQDGIIIPPRDTQAIENALVHLIDDRAYLEQIRAKAYATAQGYSWSQTAEDRIALYEQCQETRQV